MGFFVKIEFDATMISCTIELTHLADRVLCFEDSLLCLRSCYNHRKQEITV